MHTAAICVILALLGMASSMFTGMVVGEQRDSPFKLIRFNSPNYGMIPGVAVGMSDFDPKRPPENAIDGNIYSTAATTGGCDPCTLILRLPNVYFINRMTIWNVRNPPSDVEDIVWQRFRNIQVEISLDLNDVNLTAFDFTTPPIQKWVSPVYNPSPLNLQEPASVQLRSIEIDLSKRSGGGVLGNTIRIKRIAEKVPSADARQLNVADIDIYALLARTCMYSVWGPPVPDDLMCYRNPENPIVTYTQTRSILQDPTYGLTGCDQPLLRELYYNSTDLTKPCIFNHTTESCQYSYWSDWTQCNAIMCGNGTRTRTRSIINVDGCVANDNATVETQACINYRGMDCPIESSDACQTLWNTTVLQMLPNYQQQKCSNNTWHAKGLLFVQTDANLWDWLRFPGSIYVEDLMIVETDVTVGGDLIVPGGATLLVRDGAYLRILGNLHVHENATLTADQAVLQIGGLFNMSGTLQHESVANVVMFSDAQFGPPATIDVSDIDGMAWTKMCEWLDYTTPLALYSSLPGSQFNHIIHSCINISTLGNLTLEYGDGVMNVYIQPTPPIVEDTNLAPILVGSIIGGLVFFVLVIVAIVLVTGIHRDPYDQLAESQSKGKGSNYLMMV